jgi:hypothetical protein
MSLDRRTFNTLLAGTPLAAALPRPRPSARSCT